MIEQFISSRDCLSKCDDVCCRFTEKKYLPRFTEKEYLRAAKNKKLKGFFIMGRGNLWHLKANKKEGKYLLCPFVKKRVLCRIYKDRPFECWSWPFFVVRRNKNFFLANDDEECYSLKKAGSKKKIKQYIIYIKRKIDSSYFAELFRKYPLLVWNYNKKFKIICKLDFLSGELYGKDNRGH